MSDKLPILIIGAGVVGAGVAYALRNSGETVFVVDRAPRSGTGTTSRNSGVIHAGLYYPPDSFKMKLCLRGKDMLYHFAEEHGVPFLRTGKYIVANDDAQADQLTWLASNSAAPLHFVEQLPNGIRAQKALFSPTTGIVDIHLLVDALLDHSGADVLYHQTVETLEPTEEGVNVRIDGETFTAEKVVNCAGLAAPGFVEGFQTYYARGAYFQIKLPKDREVPHLVYPAIPKGSPSLGIHLTRNIHGEAYLGPDIEWIDEENYNVDEARAFRFFEAASAYLPWLRPEDLQPGYAGIRPKLAPEGFRDFTFIAENNLIHCLGIESPGITAAMAIGEHVAAMLGHGA